MQEQSTEIAVLPPAERAAVVMGTAKAEKQLREMIANSSGILSVIDVGGREEAHRAGMTLKGARVAIEKTGKVAREDAQAFSKAVIAEEKRLVAIVQPEEDRLLNLRNGFDSKAAAEKAEKERIERERKAAISAKIAMLRNIPAASVNDSAADLRATLDDLIAFDAPVEDFAEFVEPAHLAAAEAREAIHQMWHAATEREAEAVRQAEFAETNRRVAAEIERQRAALAAEEAAAKLKQQEQEAAARAEREAFEAEKRAFAEQQAAAAEAARIAALPAEPEAVTIEEVAPTPAADNSNLRVMVDREPEAAPVIIGVDMAAGDDRSVIAKFEDGQLVDVTDDFKEVTDFCQCARELLATRTPDDVRAILEDEIGRRVAMVA